ncbi:MAG: PAS domain S-box protein [Betaproteobacteria bacterium]|nr:PAS domain S-box protein [Betaproteobacteria bacterium]
MSHEIDLHQLIEVIGDAVVVSNVAGKITLWNHAAEETFGYTAVEALGQNLDIITPERFRVRHWDGYHHSMETGTMKYGKQTLRVPAVHKDGHTLSIAFTVAMLRDEHHQVSGVVAVIRDETTRFLEEKELKKRLTELESKPRA